jgi:hypothetical protein
LTVHKHKDATLLFQIYIIKTLTSVKNILKFDSIVRERQLLRLLGPEARTWLSKVDDAEVVVWANDLYQLWTRSPTPDTENP